jgi:hypothetical protein
LRWISFTGLVIALAGPVSAQPAPQPLALLDVPFISQSEALCGGAAAAMILRYWGERGLDAESFAHLVDRSAAGIRTAALIGDLRQRGWTATGIAGTEQFVEAELARGRPVLALIEDRPGTFHYIVVIAAARQAFVFHDPARAPMRVLSRAEFTRRWQPAGRWMAVIVPGQGNVANAPVPSVPAARPASACEQLVVEGIASAQAGDLADAERRLTAALDCAPIAAQRELAGIRLLQRRWPDVETLATGALDLDPADAQAWRLLGTSRFVQNDAIGALAAWNQIAEPRIDIVRVAGLERTRQRVIEGVLGARSGEVLTPASFVRARRRLGDVPAAVGSRLEYAPVPGGLVELRATIVERRAAADAWTYAAMGAIAVARREVEYSLPPLSGGGERLTAGWRFWPGRPRYSLAFTAPAPWGGLWSATFVSERQPFDAVSLARAERTTAELQVSNWVASGAHLSFSGGLADWKPAGVVATGGVTLRVRSSGERLDARVSANGWKGGSSFATIQAAAVGRSSAERRGLVFVGHLSAAAATTSVPPDGWFGGDVGTTRQTLLRAHPLVDDGRLRTAQLGRRLAAASGEVQRWWTPPLGRVGAALFVDAVRTGARLAAGARTDVDAGFGVRLAFPAVAGTFRADVARGLADGAMAFSFVYEP